MLLVTSFKLNLGYTVCTSLIFGTDLANLKVNKNNDMITSRACFTLMENRVLLYGISLINPKRDAFPLTYQIDVGRFAKMFDLDVNGLYSDLKNGVLYKMRKRTMRVRKQSPTGGFNRDFNLVQYADYEDGSGYLKITFDPESKPFIHNLTKDYTSYYVECVSKFKSSYSIRFFEWCVMRLKQNKGERVTLELTLDEIRERLDLKDKYPRYCDLKKYVIKKALDEIEANKEECGILVKLIDNKSENKKGRSVHNIQLIISPEFKPEDQLNLRLGEGKPKNNKVKMSLIKQVHLCDTKKAELDTYNFDLWRDEQVRNYVISMAVASEYE